MQSNKGEEVISSSNKASSQIDFVHRCRQLRCGVIIYCLAKKSVMALKEPVWIDPLVVFRPLSHKSI